MNDQNETTASPSEPKLCKMGCGFFVSSIGVPCILKFSFDFGDVLFSDDMEGGWLGTSACLTKGWASIPKLLVILDDLYPTGAPRSTVEAALDHSCRYSISCLLQSFSFIREVNISTHNVSTLLTFTKITGKQRHW